MVRWILRSILHGGPIEPFLVPTSAHDWYNKGRGMCCPVCRMVHIKEPLLLIGKRSPCNSGSGFPLIIIIIIIIIIFYFFFLMLLGLFVVLLACLHYIYIFYFQCDDVTEDCQEYDVL